ncbi:reverse transcriptase domain-containing protein [Tanacetum coccineum]
MVGIRDDVKEDILTDFPFEYGTLPVRYLGLPLLTKKMGATDFAPLIEKIMLQVDWIKRHLICNNSFWALKDNMTAGSWIWKKLLKYTDMAQCSIRLFIRLIWEVRIYRVRVSDQTNLGEVMERDRGWIHRNALLNQVEHEILMLKEQRVHGQEDEFLDTGTFVLQLSIFTVNMESFGGGPDGFSIYVGMDKHFEPNISGCKDRYEPFHCEKKFCQFIKGVKLPDGFGSNFKHKVKDNDSNIRGLKSHDCHIMMQRLLPYGLQQYLPTDVATPMIELCSFFKQICSRTLMVADMALEGGPIPNWWIPEIDTYRAKFKSDFPTQDMKEEFLGWFGLQIHQRYIDKDPGVSASGELYTLTCGTTSTPISVNSCVVNGASQLEEILDFSYMSFKVVLFRVKWFDTSNEGRKIKRFVIRNNIIQIWAHKESFKDFQYILATQVKQVFYLENMARRPPNWKVFEDVNHKKFSNNGVIVVENDHDVIHFNNSSDLALSTSLNDLDFATLNIDGQSMDVYVPPDIIQVDEDGDFIDDEDIVPQDLADSDDEVLSNVSHPQNSGQRSGIITLGCDFRAQNTSHENDLKRDVL